MTAKPSYVIGAGGHAKVVIATLNAAGYQVSGILDDNSHSWGQNLMGVAIQGAVTMLDSLGDIQAVIAIGNNRVRKKIATQFTHVDWLTCIHPSAHVHDSVRIGKGTVVFANAVIQPDTTVADHVIINTAATADHDCILDSFVQLAPGVHLSGATHVQEGAFMGTSSASTPQTIIGAWSTIGAGAVVTKNIPDDVIAVGVPAKPT